MAQAILSSDKMVKERPAAVGVLCVDCAREMERQQRQTAARAGDGFVGDADGAALEQPGLADTHQRRDDGA